MRVFRNILIAVGLLAGAVALSIVMNVLIPPGPGSSGSTAAVVWLMIIGTSLWAAISSSQLELRKYKTPLANSPAVIFIGHLLLWIVVFPWFLTVRDQIKEGTAELKDEFKGMPRPVPPPARKAPEESAGNTPVVPEKIPPPLPTALPRKTISAPIPASASTPGKGGPNRLEQLQKLADFKAQGVLTEEEFQAEKRRLLG